MPQSTRFGCRKFRALSLGWFGCLIWLLAGSTLLAQGVLFVEDDQLAHRLPRPIVRPAPEPIVEYQIRELVIEGEFRDQIATTQISQTFFNPGSRVLNASFVFPLPIDAAIQELTLLVDGKEFAGKLMNKDEARRIYESYVRRSRDPALLEWMGQGMFQTSVFPIPAGKERTVTLRFTQVLPAYQNVTDYLLPLATAKYTSRPIDRLSINLSVTTTEPLKSLYSPTHPVEIERLGENRARVQLQQKQTIPSNDFRLFYGADPDKVGASLLSDWPDDDDEGYWLLLASPEFAPEESQPLTKELVLVIDRSGSMSGQKIEQVKDSLRFILNHLRVGDRFNIVAYDTEVSVFRPELQALNDDTRREALGFVDTIYAGGSTNISGALTTACKLLSDASDPQYIVFLTDGLPTAGETQEGKIVELTQQANQASARLLNLGVGYDVNSRLLDRLTRAHRGHTELVRPDEDIESSISRLYQRISSPVLTDVKLTWEMDQPNVSPEALVNRVYPSPLPDLFQGEQLVVAGRYRFSGPVRVTLTGNVGDSTEVYEFKLDFTPRGATSNQQFIERIWASRRIGEIIDEIDLSGPNEELIDELVRLSIQHGILTPYTSFLADDQPSTGLADAEGQRAAAREQLNQLAEPSGSLGFGQRVSKSQLRAAGNAQGGAEPQLPGDASLEAASAEAFGGLVLPSSNPAEAPRITDRVLQIKGQAVFRQGTLWVAANARDIPTSPLPDSVVRVPRFSQTYFDLVEANTPQQNALLARLDDDGQLLIRLRDQVYLIE